MEDSATPSRVKFYSAQDFDNDWSSQQAASLIQEYSGGRKIHSFNDALELHNALAFEEHSIFPSNLDQHQREKIASSSRELRRNIVSFFACVDSSNLNAFLRDFDYQYSEDLITLVERHNVAQKVGGQSLFEALMNARMPLEIVLSNRQFVKRHARQLRDALLADPRNGELLVKLRMITNSNPSYTLPASFTSKDSQHLLSAYIDSASPHPNYVQAIAEANDNVHFGLAPKIRLQARKRFEALSQELFANDKSTLMKNGYGVQIDLEQLQPAIDCVDRETGGMTHVRSFGGQYLSSTLEPEQVLQTFALVVGYMDRQGLLTMPAFKANIGILQSLLISGKKAYPRGQDFDRIDALTLLGTQAYSSFLRPNGIEVEDTVAWFFREHLVSQFGARNFYYSASSPSSSFLERCRHISAEMESITRQFTLYCDEGELDHELLHMTSAPKPWDEIPSLAKDKYLHRRANSGCERALGLLFSDQSRLIYINKELRARSFVDLITRNQLPYDALHHYQQEPVDWLISEGLVKVDTGVIKFAHPAQVLVLGDINTLEASAYGHYGPKKSAAALDLVEKGWLEFTSTLLTSAEASYFNFYLNKSEFSDGPDLRNRYAHGTNPNPDDVAAHSKSYILLLRLLVSLVLKINDDFKLSTG